MTSAISTSGLGKQYGSTWALRDCTLEIPTGSVAALVGPNGAGKTTLLQLAVGLSQPTTGSLHVLGQEPGRDAAAMLPRVGFVAQDHPLHRGFTIADTLELGRRLNPGWDNELAHARLERLGLAPRRKVGKLSGGQQAQVALTLALAKRPELLLLDEPVASLDPVARREFMNTVMEAVADAQISVVFSSHILADLERVCDYLVILSHAHTLLASPIDEIVASHILLTGPRSDAQSFARRPRDRPRKPHRAADLAARAFGEPRLRHVLGGARDRPRGDRPRVPRLRRRIGVAQPSTRRGGGRVIWVGWREQRTEAIIASAILAALALLLVPAGLHMASAYHDQGLSICVGAHPAPACPDLISSFLPAFREDIENCLRGSPCFPG